jgi:hypothetical protein
MVLQSFWFLKRAKEPLRNCNRATRLQSPLGVRLSVLNKRRPFASAKSERKENSPVNGTLTTIARLMSESWYAQPWLTVSVTRSKLAHLPSTAAILWRRRKPSQSLASGRRLEAERPARLRIRGCRSPAVLRATFGRWSDGHGPGRAQSSRWAGGSGEGSRGSPKCVRG